jgi:dTMP kinase
VPEDRFEKEALAFHERVRQGYLTLARNEPERFRVIDASRDPESVHKEIVEVVLRLGI